MLSDRCSLSRQNLNDLVVVACEKAIQTQESRIVGHENPDHFDFQVGSAQDESRNMSSETILRHRANKARRVGLRMLPRPKRLSRKSRKPFVMEKSHSHSNICAGGILKAICQHVVRQTSEKELGCNIMNYIQNDVGQANPSRHDGEARQILVWTHLSRLFANFQNDRRQLVWAIIRLRSQLSQEIQDVTTKGNTSSPSKDLLTIDSTCSSVPPCEGIATHPTRAIINYSDFRATIPLQCSSSGDRETTETIASSIDEFVMEYVRDTDASDDNLPVFSSLPLLTQTKSASNSAIEDPNTPHSCGKRVAQSDLTYDCNTDRQSMQSLTQQTEDTAPDHTSGSASIALMSRCSTGFSHTLWERAAQTDRGKKCSQKVVMEEIFPSKQAFIESPPIYPSVWTFSEDKISTNGFEVSPSCPEQKTALLQKLQERYSMVCAEPETELESHILRGSAVALPPKRCTTVANLSGLEVRKQTERKLRFEIDKLWEAFEADTIEQRQRNLNKEC